MSIFKSGTCLLTLTTSMLALSLKADYKTGVLVKDATKPMALTKSYQAKPTTRNKATAPGLSTSVQNKPSRLLSGSVAYGTQHWSYAKVDWMEPIWQSQGKQLYTSLDYMNHLHKSNSHSHEIGSGLVLWQPLASDRELGLGAYWLNYNSWHNLRHHGLRLGAKVIWQDWQVTGNGFFKLSKAKQGKPGQQLHPYFGSGLLVTEQVLNGVDMIVGTKVGELEWQAMAYHYPKKTNQTSQLLSTGMGLQASIKLNPLPNRPYSARIHAKALYDNRKKYLFMTGLTLSNRTAQNHTHTIYKTDTDGPTGIVYTAEEIACYGKQATIDNSC